LVKPVTASMLLDAIVEARAGNTYTHNSNYIAEPRLAGMRVLLVEDNPNNQQVAFELLDGEGALVQIANNGKEAVDQLAGAIANSEPFFDVVLMDLQMPVMDGFTATKLIRSDLELSDLPIIAMTANAMASDRDACIKAGMDDHVGKPFDLDHLIMVLRKQAGWPQFSIESPGHEVTLPLHAIQAHIYELAADAGVDLQATLKRMGGKRDLYIRMFPMFLTTLENFPEQLQAELACADHLAASRLLHSLKGLASTMGAVELAALAGKGEKQFACLDNKEMDNQQIEDTPIDEQLSAAIAAAIPKMNILFAALQQDTDIEIEQGNNDSIPDTQEALKLLPILEQHLKNFDMAALGVMDELQRSCGKAFDEQLTPLRDAIDTLNFERALQLSNELIQSNLFTKG